MVSRVASCATQRQVGAHLACVEATLHPPHVVTISVYSTIHLLNVYSQIVGLKAGVTYSSTIVRKLRYWLARSQLELKRTDIISLLLSLQKLLVHWKEASCWWPTPSKWVHIFTVNLLSLASENKSCVWLTSLAWRNVFFYENGPCDILYLPSGNIGVYRCHKIIWIHMYICRLCRYTYMVFILYPYWFFMYSVQGLLFHVNIFISLYIWWK